MILNNRYKLEAMLGQGGMGSVYRASDRLTGQYVALKRVLAPEAHLDFASRAQADVRLSLAHEFRTLAALRHPHIISVLDYGFDEQGRAFFTMELLEDRRTLIDASRALPPTERLGLLIQVLEALRYLHHRHLLHRDLKPANILITPEGQVKLVDFGLTVIEELAHGAGGTPGYVAPEVFQRERPTVASDLYAVGVLIFQVLVGALPIPLDSMTGYLAQMLAGVPDLGRLERLDLPGIDKRPLVALVRALLDPNPAARPAAVEVVLHELRACLGLADDAETDDIRESYITAAPLVGRQKELSVLEAALAQTLAGETSFWLVGGESGVGKTRLVDEVRTLALVKGMEVLRGGAAASGGLPLQVWRDVVHHLLLHVEVDDLEAAILQELVPDIAHLIGRPLPQAPPLGATAHQQRLVMTIVDLFRRLPTPTLLILEDLQWSRVGLAPLQHLLKVQAQLPPLMVIGTYRHDERPSLPDELPGAAPIMLARFERERIAALCTAMVGHAGDDLIDVMQAQTEGNAFFMVEVVRTLAADAGGLSEIGTRTLPREVLTGGMRAVLQRRLAQTSVAYVPLLHRAAIIGRQIDTTLLNHMLPDADINGWLYQAESAAILSVDHARWRFAHDRLRDAAVENLRADYRAALHHEVATAIEAVYPNDPDYSEALLEHWHQAGEVDRAFPYLNQVAIHYVHVVGNYAYGRWLLERGLETLPPGDGRRATLLNWLAHAHERLRHFEHVIPLAEEARELAAQHNDERNIAVSLNQLGLAAFGQGQLQRARDYFQQSLDIREALGDQLDVCNILINLGVLAFFQGEVDEARACFERGLALGRATGDQLAISHALNNAGALAGYEANYAQARDYLEESIVTCRAVGHRVGLANSLANLGFVYIKLDDARADDCFVDGLAVAWAIQALAVALEIIVGFAWLRLRAGDALGAAELAGLARHHAARSQDVDARLEELLPLVADALPPDEREAALQRGATLPLEAVVADLTAPDRPR